MNIYCHCLCIANSKHQHLNKRCLSVSLPCMLRVCSLVGAGVSLGWLMLVFYERKILLASWFGLVEINKRTGCEYTSSLVHAATSVDYTQTLVSLIMEQIKKNEREESKRQERKQGVYDWARGPHMGYLNMGGKRFDDPSTCPVTCTAQPKNNSVGDTLQTKAILMTVLTHH